MGAGTLGLGIIHPLQLGHDTSNSLVTTEPRAVVIATDIAMAMETTTDITVIMDTTFIDQAKNSDLVSEGNRQTKGNLICGFI